MASKSFDDLNESKLKQLLKIDPDLATSLGLHEPYDWQLPHGGFKRHEETRSLLESWFTEASAIAEKEGFTLEQELALKSLKAALDILKFSLDDHPLWKMNPDALDLPGGLLFVMLTKDYAPFDQRISAINSRIKRLPQFIAEFESRFEDSKPVRPWIRTAIEAAEQFPGFLTVILETAKGKVSDSLHDDLAKSIGECESAVKEYVAWLNGLEPRSTDKFAMGKRKFAKMIKIRGFGMTPEKIMGLGEKYLEEFKKEREKVAERLAPGKGIEGAEEVVRANSPATFEDALASTREIMNRARQFIIDHDLATVYPDARLEVVETPAFMAPLLPYAAMYVPAKFDVHQEGIYIVTRPKDPKDLTANLNYASIINTAVHEAYPGHFLQGVASNRKDWMFQLAGSGSDTVASTPEAHEGWAHYCEKMMFDHGFEANDAAEYEMLKGAIWRACRIIADIKLSQGLATIDEMVEWMTKETGMARASIQGEVDRYSRTPGQPLSYMIGRHLMLELRKDLETNLGDRFDEKAFHDAVLDYGALPFNLLKEAVVAKLEVEGPRKPL